MLIAQQLHLHFSGQQKTLQAFFSGLPGEYQESLAGPRGPGKLKTQIQAKLNDAKEINGPVSPSATPPVKRKHKHRNTNRPSQAPAARKQRKDTRKAVAKEQKVPEKKMRAARSIAFGSRETLGGTFPPTLLRFLPRPASFPLFGLS
jgi:hypothetical protein